MCECSKNEYTFEKIQEIKDFLTRKCSIQPKIGIICGSGLGSLAESVQQATTFHYKDIPHFPLSTVAGHKGTLVFGYISQVPVVCMQGRFHYYEGYPLSKCVMPVRLMKLLGCTHLIASNAAGSINPTYRVGDVMLLKDHYNIMGLSGIGPMIGTNDERFGRKFFSMTEAYDPLILSNVLEIARQLQMQDMIHVGVYTCVGGPNYETVAEVRGLAALGIDACGMSTVHEIVAARQCGLTCFAFSLITNKCTMEYRNVDGSSGKRQQQVNGQDEVGGADHDEVLAAARASEEKLKVFVSKVVECIGQQF